jgi:SAM-dependent methyltransferase
MTGESDTLRDYYGRRAWEYERIYHRDDPIRQQEQRAIAAGIRQACAGRAGPAPTSYAREGSGAFDRLPSLQAQLVPAGATGRRALEVACGTGYWTAVAAQVAQHVVAIDVSPEVLQIARRKGLPRDRVRFIEADAYALEGVPGTFDAGLANFWLSHVPKSRIDEFVRGFHDRLGAGAIVFMADNVYVPGIGGELITRPGSEDTFKVRRLADGSAHEVLKNYYDEEHLRRILESRSRDLDVHVGTCFWWVRYVVN